MSPQDENTTKARVVLVGIGGASCSGKTSLAKILHRVIPNSVILHQDDFAPPMESIPYHPVHGVQDWDSPATAIDWPRLRAFLQNIKETGIIPAEHRSADSFNQQSTLPIDQNSLQGWCEKFEAFANASEEKIIWALVDGFMLYWDPVVTEQFDLRVLLRVPHDILKERRESRATYVTVDEETWTDPPKYWENIVWPAYIEAHKGLFTNEDVEKGQLEKERVNDILLLEIDSEKYPMDDLVSKSCQYFTDYMNKL